MSDEHDTLPNDHIHYQPLLQWQRDLRLVPSSDEVIGPATAGQAGDWNRAFSTKVPEGPAPIKGGGTIPSKANGLKLYVYPKDEGHQETPLQGSNQAPSYHECYLSTPLDAGKHQIRVLDLLPGLLGIPLEGKLRISSLEQGSGLQGQHDYEALSYTWGPTTKNEQLFLSDEKLSITDNCATALRALHCSDVVRTLWVDAICTNQADSVEREQQVRIMRSVYASCRNVLIWLGSVATEATTKPQMVINDLMAETGILRELYAYVDTVVGETHNISTDKWWGRAWTIQEAVVAPKAYICLGPYRILWAEFCHHLLHVNSDARVTTEYKYTTESFDTKRAALTERFREVESLRRIRDEPASSRQFLPILLAADASKPHDKVFSVLGLLDPRHAEELSPDYSCKVADLFARATHSIIKYDNSLGVLFYRSLDTSRHQVADLPSWTLEFTDQDSYCTDRVRIMPFDIETSVVPPSAHVIASLNDGAQVLTLSGYILDEVHDVIGSDVYHNGLWNRKLRPAIEALASSSLVGRLVYDGLGTLADDEQKATALVLPEYDPILESHLARFRRETWQSSMWLIVEAFVIWNLVVKRTAIPEDGRGRLFEKLSRFTTYAGAASMKVHATSMWSTLEGFMGLSPHGILRGDVIALLNGSRHPVVLRPLDDYFNEFAFQGMAYVHGVMEGELLPLFERGVFEEREFRLR